MTPQLPYAQLAVLTPDLLAAPVPTNPVILLADDHGRIVTAHQGHWQTWWTSTLGAAGQALGANGTFNFVTPAGAIGAVMAPCITTLAVCASAITNLSLEDAGPAVVWTMPIRVANAAREYVFPTPLIGEGNVWTIRTSAACTVWAAAAGFTFRRA